ncbi:MAG TPA: cytochrome c biogenesis protein CcdA [Ramlibacter sp.]|nr:cytochrome c biogenesis protein CcdA [Ramlibacter sp.]
MTRKLSLLIGGTLLLFGLVYVFRLDNIGTTALWNLSEGGKWLLPLISVAALIDSINPCAFSILLLTIAFLLSIGKLRSSVLAIGSAYILGIYVVYLVIGLGLLQTLHLFNTPHFMAKLGATLLIVLGLVNLLKEAFPAFPLRLAIPHVAHHRIAVLMEKASIPTAVVLGGLVGLCEFPCTGGPYLMVLGLLHDHATYYTGAAYLTLYNVIFVLPLVLILLIASDQTLLAKVQAWQQSERKSMRWAGGLAMVALGGVIFLV